MQKRKFSRVVFQSEAAVQFEDREIKGEVKNLSLKGMFLSTAERVPVDKEVEIKVFLSGSTSELILSVKGTVKRHEDNGMAFAFSVMDLDSFIHLKNIIAYNMGDSEVVMEEFFQYMEQDKF